MPRTYSLPVFNLTCSVWKGQLPARTDRWPLARPPRAPDLAPACQLYVSGKAGATSARVQITPGGLFFSFNGPGIELRLPAGTLVTHPYGNFAGAVFDLIECPAGSGVFYVPFLVIDQHKGFANEYRLAYVAPAFRYGADEDSLRGDLAIAFTAGRATA